MRALLLSGLMILSIPAFGHDRWANGEVVPAWIKKACCGPDDVHHLTDAEVHARADGYHVNGLRRPIPYDSVLPSQDGDYWGFWTRTYDDSESPVYCFFAPPRGA